VPAVAVQLVAPADVNCCVAPRFSETLVGEICCVVGLRRVTIADAEPAIPVAVTVTLLLAGMVAGAVYKPVALTVPAVAVHMVAPEDVNCWVAPRFSETLVGEMCWALGSTRVTEADADPPGPVAVTVTWSEAGMVAGAVYSPVLLTIPAVAVQEVAPEEVNCWVAPRFTEALVGEMVCGGGGVVETNGTLNTGPQSVPGLAICAGTSSALPCHTLTFRVVELTKVVPVEAPPTNAVAPCTKPVPVNVRVALPTGTGLGETEVMAGPAGATLT